MSAAPTNPPPQDGSAPGTGAALPSQRPPAPPPPPTREVSAAGAPGGAPGAAGTTAGGPKSETNRRHARHRLGDRPPARVALTNRQPVFVTLDDISAGGCCIVRKGQLELANGDTVLVDVWTQDIDTKLSIPARVCWCTHEDSTSRAGLRFVETNHRLQRQIESYVERFRRRAEDSRPQPWIPSQSGGSGGEPRLSPPPPAPAPPQPAPEFLLEFAPPSGPESSPRPRPGERGGSRSLRASQRRQLPAMPRPQPLSSVGLQRRMQAAHRQEVARIAEETGIHIHTLYGWLRALQLEGTVDPTRPRDPEAWSAADKVSVLLQAVGMSAAERSAFCSRHGIGEQQLARWRQAALQANEKPMLILRAEEELQRLQVRDQRDIRRLQREQRRIRTELRHLERSAAINAELLEVVRKLQILWEQGEGQ